MWHQWSPKSRKCTVWIGSHFWAVVLVGILQGVAHAGTPWERHRPARSPFINAVFRGKLLFSTHPVYDPTSPSHGISKHDACLWSSFVIALEIQAAKWSKSCSTTQCRPGVFLKYNLATVSHTESCFFFLFSPSHQHLQRQGVCGPGEGKSCRQENLRRC